MLALKMCFPSSMWDKSHAFKKKKTWAVRCQVIVQVFKGFVIEFSGLELTAAGFEACGVKR
jgi:hypothetical protein